MKICHLTPPSAGRRLAAAEGGLRAAAAGVSGLDGHEAEGRADGGPGQGGRGQEEGGGGRLPRGQAARAPLQEEIFQCRVPGKCIVTTLKRRINALSADILGYRCVWAFFGWSWLDLGWEYVLNIQPPFPGPQKIPSFSLKCRSLVRPGDIRSDCTHSG